MAKRTAANAPARPRVIPFVPRRTQCPECEAEGHHNPPGEVYCDHTNGALHYMRCRRCREMIEQAAKPLPSGVHPKRPRDWRFQALDVTTAAVLEAEAQRRQLREAKLEVEHTQRVLADAKPFAGRATRRLEDAQAAHAQAVQRLADLEKENE